MNPNRFAALLALGLPVLVASCGKQEEAKPQAQAEPQPPAPVVAAAPPQTEAPKPAAAPKAAEPTMPSEFAVTSPDAGLGDFGSMEPMEREDQPERGIISFPVEQQTNFTTGPHWEQYSFSFKTKRWGRYNVRLTYQLKTSTLGVQLKFGEDRLKKQLTNTNGGEKRTTLGEIYIPTAGDQFLALYTPQNVGYIQFYPKSVELIPAGEGGDVKQAGDGTVALHAKDATTWSESMRYEPKPEKNCLGFWSDPQDFAEWEFTVDKPGKFAVTVHQGCAGGGGSEVALLLEKQELKFKVQDTGGYQNWTPVSVGELKIDKPGTYRLAVKPQSKNGGAVMDVQKVVLAPVS